MNYKKIIKSRETRFAILKVLSFIPDSVMLRVQYRIKMGFWPNFKHPKRYTEKLQLYKMMYRNPVMHQCVDKYEVRKFVESKGLSHILVPLYGVYNHASEINLNELPEQFVAKTTDGGGGNNVIIVRDKSQLDVEKFRKDLNGWIHTKGGTTSGREWAYTGIKQSRIIIEKYLEDDLQIGRGSLSDYKLMFFDGTFRCLWIDKDRHTNHHRGFWDENLDFLYGIKSDHDTFDTPPVLPGTIHEMIKIGEILSKDFPYARIDLYDVNGKVMFGEITFYPWSGYVRFEPDEFDFCLGSFFDKYD